MLEPKELEPVLAKIRHITAIGTSEWYEVIFFDPEKRKWSGFAGGTEFHDGEVVVAYRKVEDLDKYLESC